MPDFPGFVSYRFTTELKTGCNYERDLGEVGQAARLELNGHDLDWHGCSPYRFTLPADAIINGTNTFRVNMATTLANAFKDEFSFYIQIPRSGLFDPITLFCQCQ